jgi:hypothetical protein
MADVAAVSPLARKAGETVPDVGYFQLGWCVMHKIAGGLAAIFVVAGLSAGMSACGNPGPGGCVIEDSTSTSVGNGAYYLAVNAGSQKCAAAVASLKGTANATVVSGLPSGAVPICAGDVPASSPVGGLGKITVYLPAKPSILGTLMANAVCNHTTNTEFEQSGEGPAS